MTSTQLPMLHRAFLERVMPIFQADPRLMGVAAGGSYLTGRMDEHSDLDLVLVHTDESRSDVLAHRHAFARSLGGLLQAFTGEHVGEPRLLICLYGPPLLHVDLKFVSTSELRARIEDPIVLWQRGSALTEILKTTRRNVLPPADPQWIENRFWAWVHYTATKIERGELFEALDALAHMRLNVFAPLIASVEATSLRGLRRIEHDAPRWSDALARTCARHDRAECFRALHAAVELYIGLREECGAVSEDRRSPAECAVRDDLSSRFETTPT